MVAGLVHECVYISFSENVLNTFTGGAKLVTQKQITEHFILLCLQPNFEIFIVLEN